MSPIRQFFEPVRPICDPETENSKKINLKQNTHTEKKNIEREEEQIQERDNT